MVVFKKHDSRKDHIPCGSIYLLYLWYGIYLHFVLTKLFTWMLYVKMNHTLFSQSKRSDITNPQFLSLVPQFSVHQRFMIIIRSIEVPFRLIIKLVICIKRETYIPVTFRSECHIWLFFLCRSIQTFCEIIEKWLTWLSRVRINDVWKMWIYCSSLPILKDKK